MSRWPAGAPGRRLPALAVGMLALAVPLRAATAPPVTTEQDMVVSTRPELHAVSPHLLVTADGAVHVVWQQGLQGVDPGEPLIMHRYRSPTGTWSAPAEVYWDGVQPTIATDGSSVAVAFVRNPFDRFDTTEVLYKVWDAESGQWPDLPVALIGDVGLAGSQPDLAFDRFHGYLWLVWSSSLDGKQVPYYARILVDGYQTDSAKPVAENEEGVQGLALTVDAENNIHVAWSADFASGEAEVMRWEWPEGGAGWLNRDSTLYDQIRQARAPDISAAGGVVCVTWHEGSLAQANEVILSCDRTGGGNLFFGNISHSPGARSLLPSLALDERRGAMVLWHERSSPPQLLFGQVVPPRALGNTEVTSGTVDMPSLVYHDGYAHAVWVEDTTEAGSQVRYARWRVDPPTPTPTLTPTATVTPTGAATITLTPRPWRTATPTATDDRTHHIFSPFLRQTLP